MGFLRLETWQTLQSLCAWRLVELTWLYYTNRMSTFLGKKEKRKENPWTKWVESCMRRPWWHHRSWYSCQLNYTHNWDYLTFKIYNSQQNYQIELKISVYSSVRSNHSDVCGGSAFLHQSYWKHEKAVIYYTFIS